MRRLIFGSFLVAALLAALIGLAGSSGLFSGGSSPAEAVHGSTPGTVDFVSLDMDPTLAPANSGAEGNVAACGDDGGVNPSTGNGVDNDGDTVADDGCPGSGIAAVHTLGTRQTCISKTSGPPFSLGVTDFDVDITVDEVDRADDIEGWQATLNFDPTKLNVITPISDTSPLTLLGGGLVDSTAGAPEGPVTSFTAAPGADGPDGDLIPEGPDGTFVFSVADLGFAEVGHGILARFRLRSVGSGVSALTLLPAQLKKPVNANLPIGLVQNGTEAQDEACPNPADMAKLGIDMSALPASVPAGNVEDPLSPTPGP